jgi:hypothetical protein
VVIARVCEISILSQLPPWPSEKLAWLDTPNLAARECSVATGGLKKIDTSLPTMGSIQLHFIVFSDDSECWSNCCELLSIGKCGMYCIFDIAMAFEW